MQYRDPPPMQKGQNPKKYVMQNFEELKFVDNIDCSQRGNLRLHRFHPFVKYMVSKLVCSVPKMSLQQGQADYLLNQYQERCNIRQPHIIYSIASESQIVQKNTQQGLVELFQIYLFFEFNQLNLDQLTDKRKLQKFLIPESEVWCLIQGIVSAMSYFQQQNISHGMLTLKNIYFDEEYLLYRIYDQELISGRWGIWNKCFGFKKGKQQADFNQNDYHECMQYLAPETLKFFDQDNQQIDGKLNPFKADVFSFGISLLKCLSMKQMINNQKMIEWILQFYSSELVCLITQCTETNSQDRPDWVILQQKLKEIPESIQKQNSVQQNDMIKTNPIIQNAPQTIQVNDDQEIDQKILKLNLKIQETLVKSFSKSRSLK